MIIVADTPVMHAAMLAFMRNHGLNPHDSEDLRMIGRVEHGQLIGVVAYNGFCGRVCQMHVAGDGNFVSREFLRAAFHYPFVQLELTAVMGVVAANNKRAIRFDGHVGFREVYRVQSGWADGVDLMLLELKREDCKYIETDHELAKAA